MDATFLQFFHLLKNTTINLKKIVLLICIALLLNSCATILNGSNTKVKIYAPENTTVEYNNQTYILDEGKTNIFPERSRDSLKFTLKKDSVSTDFAFKRRTSPLFYLNLPYTYGLGMLVDFTNEKRFTYKRNLSFEIDSTTNTFQIYKGKSNPFKQHNVFIYTSPLLAIDVFTQPMLSIGTEYFPLENLSISVEYATVYTNRLRDNSKPKSFENKGRSFRYELKYYNLVSISNNPRVNEYIGIEARFIRQQYNKELRYYRTNQDINYFINEPIAVFKSVDIFNLKYGLNFPVGKRMYIDLYSGLGYRHKTFKNPNRLYNPEADELIDDIDHYWRINNNYLEDRDDSKLFNFSLGFKFGIKF